MDIALEQFARASEAPMMRAQRWHYVLRSLRQYDSLVRLDFNRLT